MFVFEFEFELVLVLILVLVLVLVVVLVVVVNHVPLSHAYPIRLGVKLHKFTLSLVIVVGAGGGGSVEVVEVMSIRMVGASDHSKSCRIACLPFCSRTSIRSSSWRGFSLSPRIAQLACCHIRPGVTHVHHHSLNRL